MLEIRGSVFIRQPPPSLASTFPLYTPVPTLAMLLGQATRTLRSLGSSPLHQLAATDVAPSPAIHTAVSSLAMLHAAGSGVTVTVRNTRLSMPRYELTCVQVELVALRRIVSCTATAPLGFVSNMVLEVLEWLRGRLVELEGRALFALSKKSACTEQLGQ